MRSLSLQRQHELTAQHGGDLAGYQIPMAHVLHHSIIPPLGVIGIWSNDNSCHTKTMCTIMHIILRMTSIIILPQIVVKEKPTINKIRGSNKDVIIVIIIERNKRNVS